MSILSVIHVPEDFIPLTPTDKKVYTSNNPFNISIQKKDELFDAVGGVTNLVFHYPGIGSFSGGVVGDYITLFSDDGLYSVSGYILSINTGTRIVNIDAPVGSIPNTDGFILHYKDTDWYALIGFKGRYLKTTYGPTGVVSFDIQGLIQSAFDEPTLEFPDCEITSGTDNRRDDTGYYLTDNVTIDYYTSLVSAVTHYFSQQYTFIKGSEQIGTTLKNCLAQYVDKITYSNYANNTSFLFPSDGVTWLTPAHVDVAMLQHTKERLIYKGFTVQKAGNILLRLYAMTCSGWSESLYVRVKLYNKTTNVVYDKQFLITVPGATNGDPISFTGGILYFELNDVPDFNVATMSLYNNDPVYALEDFYTSFELYGLPKFINKFDRPIMYRGLPFTFSWFNKTTDVKRLEVIQYDANGVKTTLNEQKPIDGQLGSNYMKAYSLCRLYQRTEGDYDEDLTYNYNETHLEPTTKTLKIRVLKDSDGSVYSQQMTVDVKEACDDSLLLHWKNFHGGDQYFMFNKYRDYQYQYNDRTVTRVILMAEGLTYNEWEVLNELNTSTTLYKQATSNFGDTIRTTSKVGQFVNLVGPHIIKSLSTSNTYKNITGVVVIPTEYKVKFVGYTRRIEIMIELPDTYTP